MDANTNRGDFCKQSRAVERKITIGKTESRRAGTGGRCMDFLRAILYCTIRAQEGGGGEGTGGREGGIDTSRCGGLGRIYTQG
eukprot:COSAG05_NODE_1251_length_5381_cov_82.840591_8_plen_83_part_00